MRALSHATRPHVTRHNLPKDALKMANANVRHYTKMTSAYVKGATRVEDASRIYTEKKE